MLTHTTPLEDLRQLGAELPFAVIATDAKDDRRNRDYHRGVDVSLSIEFENRDEVRKTVPAVSRVRDLAVEILRSRGIRIHPDRALASDACGAKITRLTSPGYYDTWSPLTMHWCVQLSAERPSEIPSEDAAVEWAREHLCPALGEAFQAASEELRERKRREEAARQATHIARWAAAYAVKEAKRVTRYEQRLAALVAEMNAEIEVQVKRMRAEGIVEEAVAKEYEGEPAPEALQYAVQHFHERTKGWNGGFLGSGSSRDYVPEDLYE